MTKKTDTPAIRFKGYSDTWEQRKFGEVGETYTGLSGKSKDDFGHGSGKFITYMNIFSNPVASPNMTESIEIDDSQNKVRFGDVLFTTSSETPDEVGMSSVWLENAENTYLNSFCFGYRPTAEFNPYYLAYMLRSSSMRKKITFLAQGISRYNISKNKMMDIEMPIPSIDEQKQIGEYFANLDRLITLHQRKYEKLHNIKKSMLEKMFPKNGSNVPEIRFKGFTEAWEQRKFDEVFDCTIPNNTLSRAELNYESGSVRNIHYGDILIKYGSVVDVQNDEIPFATGKSNDDFKGALLQDGDIIIADTAEDETTGKACEIGNSQGLDVVSGLHTMVCRPRNKMALGYLGYYLNSDAYHHQLLPLMQGIKVLSLSRTNVQKTMVCYPKSKAEQQLIADCFRNLDNLITLHQRELEKLQNIKKSMLEKMFV